MIPSTSISIIYINHKPLNNFHTDAYFSHEHLKHTYIVKEFISLTSDTHYATETYLIFKGATQISDIYFESSPDTSVYVSFYSHPLFSSQTGFLHSLFLLVLLTWNYISVMVQIILKVEIWKDNQNLISTASTKQGNK